MLKKAACVLIPNHDFNKFLATSRRDNHNLWGLPGGKVDEGETLAKAAARELLEETGINLDANKLIPFFTEQIGDYLCTTFSAPRISENVALCGDSTLAQGFQPECVLTTEGSTPFKDYNVNMFKAARAEGLLPEPD